MWNRLDLREMDFFMWETIFLLKHFDSMQYAKVRLSELCTQDVRTSALIQDEIEKLLDYREDFYPASNIDIFLYSVYVKIIDLLC
jgi:hypothetical protein